MNEDGAGRVTIVAFDGIVANTLPLRTTALADAIAFECVTLGLSVHAHELFPLVLPLLPGRTFNETMAVAVAGLPALQHEQIRDDLTLHDLIAMRAQRAWSAMVAHGVPLHDGVLSRLQAHVGRGLRIVLRSDSQRREVEPLLRLAGLEDSMLFLRCADDLPRLAGVSSWRASYEAIDARLDRHRLPHAQRIAVEVNAEKATFALGFAATSRTSL